MSQIELLDDLQLWVSERKGKIPIEVLYLPRPASDYKGCYPLHFEHHLPRLLETNDYIHFFGGKATSGFRIDINPDVKPDLVANCENLSMIKSNSKNGGMADPPYNLEFEIGRAVV